jgi:hypothetical protein
VRVGVVFLLVFEQQSLKSSITEDAATLVRLQQGTTKEAEEAFRQQRIVNLVLNILYFPQKEFNQLIFT